MAKIVTITNPLTGQPAQVDQLDHTAQQIDDGLNIARGVSNPNLLDNWYFGNPVNQRQGRVVKPNTTYYSDNTLATAAGTTSAYVTAYRYATGTASGVNYASFKLEDSDTAPTYYAAPENVVRGYTGAGYGIDRFVSESQAISVLIGDGCITLIKDGTSGGWWKQRFPVSYAGEIATVSILLFDGTMRSVTSMLSDTLSFINISENVYLGICSTYFGIYFNTNEENSVQIKAVKLELGSQQTLAHQENGVWVLNEIPDYGEQLARCQRYGFHQRITYAYGYCVNDTLAYVCIPCPASLRKIPAITVNNPGALNFASQQINAQSLGVANMDSNLLYIAVSASGLTPNTVCVLHDADIYIAADL